MNRCLDIRHSCSLHPQECISQSPSMEFSPPPSYFFLYFLSPPPSSSSQSSPSSCRPAPAISVQCFCINLRFCTKRFCTTRHSCPRTNGKQLQGWTLYFNRWPDIRTFGRHFPGTRTAQSPSMWLSPPPSYFLYFFLYFL